MKIRGREGDVAEFPVMLSPLRICVSAAEGSTTAMHASLVDLD